MADLLLGVDGGGSKTRALLANISGSVLGVGMADSSNYQSVGFEAATTSLENAIAAAYAQAGIPVDGNAADAACFGLAGVDRPGDRALFEAWSHQNKLASRSLFVNDAELVLAGGTPEGWGIALICGTGSICYGRASDGRITRAGGWGYLIGDEGSGYDISVRALRLAAQTADGRADADSLLAAILAAWKLDTPSDLVGYIYRPERTRAEIAALAQVVAELASQGDEAAQAIMEQAAIELGRLIAVVMRKLDLDEPPIAFGGGLVGSDSNFQHAILSRVGVPTGPARYVNDPAQGALVLAQRMLRRSA